MQSQLQLTKLSFKMNNGIKFMQRKSLKITAAVVIVNLIFSVMVFAQKVLPPAPVGAVPSNRQLAWHQLEFYGFIHFTVNTFTDKEWGYGDEDPNIFNPTQFDARQWAKTAKQAGMKGLILTAKHHDGFCLWQTKYTKHSVASSKWMDGKGDVVKALANACREYGLKFGVYLSPWDRNHPDYGRPEYIEYYRNQLRELLTQYGDIFEVWFDGANGGTGFYGGARENRKIDRATYYDWQNTWKIVRELQPLAVMFSDAGPDIRWVGNESGFAYETSWLTINLEGLYPGHPDYVKKYAQGNPDGKDWCPPEVDVSIRPGWFYHSAEDSKVKTVQQLVDIYYKSVGRSANLLLNLPPDRRGLINEIDAQRLIEFGKIINQTFKNNLTKGAKATSSNTRGNSSNFSPSKALDNKFDTYWATDDAVTNGWIEVELKAPTRFDRVLLQEYIPLGQRVKKWNVEGWIDNQWKSICEGTTIGYKRIFRVEPVTCQRVRLTITDAKACPTISEFELYLSPDQK